MMTSPDSDVVTLAGGAAEISGLGADALTVGLDALLATVHPDDRAAMSEARAISC